MSYDQWKTASPYDDDIDEIEEAERFLRQTPEGKDPQTDWARAVVEMLLRVIDEEL